jgi:hypothetical protein
MNFKKLTFALAILTVTAACQRDSRAPEKKVVPTSPAAPVGNAQVQKSDKDLLKKDQERRQAKRQEMFISNPNVSKAPMIKKPRLDDILAGHLETINNTDAELSALRFVLTVQGKEPMPLKYSLDKKLNAKGLYTALTAEDKNSKVVAEARCLASCQDVMVRVRRDGEEVAFWFRGLELMELPQLNEERGAKRILDTSRTMEIAFQAQQALENSLRSLVANKVQIEAITVNDEEVQRAKATLKGMTEQVAGATGEVYQLANLVLKGGAMIPDLASAPKRRLLSVAQNSAVVSSIVQKHNQTLASEFEKNVKMLNELSEKLTLLNQYLVSSK